MLLNRNSHKFFTAGFTVLSLAFIHPNLATGAQGPQDAPQGGELVALPAVPSIGVTSSTKNPLQIAILHWYDANQTASFAVGTSPLGVAFDGANIWVANVHSNTVTKLRASDGACVGGQPARTFPVGTNPEGVAFAGANIWVANAVGNIVTNLRASDGSNMGTFTVGDFSPTGVAFDGANVWVACAGGLGTTGHTVTKLRASDGACVGGQLACTFPVGSFPIGVAFDGANIWVANQNSNTVSKL
jgi:hypothetical protein